MAISYAKFFQPTTLGVAAATIFTVPSNAPSNVLRGMRVRLTNTTTTSRTARLHAVPNAGAVADGNAFFFDQTVPATGYVDVDVPQMAVGDTLQALASAASAINIQALSGAIFSA